MPAYRLDPYWRVVGVHWADNDHQWAIIKAGTDQADVDYVGQTDQARSRPDFMDINGRVLVSTFLNHADALEAWQAILDEHTDPLAHQLLVWEKSTEFPTPPVDYADWGVEDSYQGQLSWYIRVGCNSVNNTIPDGHCPPDAYVVGGFGLSATADHALNWVAWQESLAPKLGSTTLFFEAYGESPIAGACSVGSAV